MRRTAQQIVDLISHGLGKTPDARNDLWQLVNDAGRQLVTARDWPWRTAVAVPLFTVAGQEWLEIPADYGGDPVVTADSGFPVLPASYAQIQQLRSVTQVTGTSGWYVTFDAYAVQPSQSGTPKARMDIFPTPTATGPWGQLVYKRGWRDLLQADPTLCPSTPPEYDLAIVLLARGLAEVLENQSDSIESARAQAEIERLWAWECSKKTNHGPMGGGAGRFMKPSQGSGPQAMGRYGTFSTS